MTVRGSLRIWFATIAICASVVALLTLPATVGPVKQAEAADAGNWNPGKIIDDALFYDSNAMDVNGIQAFLNQQVRSCQAGYTCLKDYRQNTDNRPADQFCNGYTGRANESAAQIIDAVARSCGISQKVILVLLQKEQSLVTSTAPSREAYAAATGQGCPDSAPCNPSTSGFFYQVYYAARQYEIYRLTPASWGYQAGRWNNILYHPDASRNCGSARVFIENQATAGLYIYTPYVPNAAALSNLYGTGDRCSSYGNRNFWRLYTDWFGPPAQPPRSPFGNLEILSAEPGFFRVAGWAADPDTTAPIEVHIYVKGVGFPIVANGHRPDVGAAFPTSGPNHGFDVKLPAQGSGVVDVCVHAINVGPGANNRFGCIAIDSMSGPPVGAIDTFKIVPGGVEVAGWALDPDTTSSIEVHAYVDGSGIPLKASESRQDLVPHYPAYGAAHGFRALLKAVPGSRNVCLYAINTAAGSTTTLRCERVMIPGPPDVGQTPIGAVDAATLNGNAATVQGWTIDGDTTAPIKIHMYVNGVGREYTADKVRNDVAAVYPAFGPNHGFSEQVQLPPGRSDICIWGINTSGDHRLLGCKTVARPEPRSPIGNFELLNAGSGGATVAGWALDPDTSAPIKMHVYVDGVRTEFTADRSRPDVAAAFGMGDRHGYERFLPMSSGRHQVCVWALDSDGGANVTFGCRAVVVG